MQLLRIVVPLLVLCLASSLDIDFCTMNECQGIPHLGCNNNLTFHASCLPKRHLINMQMYKEYLLKIHNKYREDVASGTFPGVPKAFSMPELVWHPKLALMAQYHAKRCRRNISTYCVAVANITKPAVNYGSIRLKVNTNLPSWSSEQLSTMTESWLNGVYKLAQYEISPQIRNILNDKNYFMGCAASEDSDQQIRHFVLICYFNERYQVGDPIYKKGTFSSDNCTFGGSNDYPHLCMTNLYTED